MFKFLLIVLGLELVYICILLLIRNSLTAYPELFRLIIPGMIAIPALTDLLIRWKRSDAEGDVPAPAGPVFRRSVRRTKSLETRLRAIPRFALIVLISAVMVASASLVWVVYPTVLQRAGTGLPVTAHWTAAVTVTILMLSTFILWNKNSSKHRKFIRLQEAIQYQTKMLAEQGGSDRESRASGSQDPHLRGGDNGSD